MKSLTHLTITFNVADFLQNLVHIEITCQSQHLSHQFQLEALAIDQGLSVLNLQITDPNNQAIPFTTGPNQINIPASDFRIMYTIQTTYADCIGADVDVELVYPFMNSSEIFLGSGIIAHPSPLRDLETDIQAALYIENLPSNWNLISNFIGDSISPATLDGFFFYTTPQLVLDFHKYAGQHQSITFRLAVQHAKTIPFTTQELWEYVDTCLNWIETHLAPYQQSPEINILILQSPDDFQNIAQRPTFATGENVLNGIITYGPDNPVYFQRLFGYADYKTFLLDGIAHELMHTYTTTSWQGKYKAVLVPTTDCPSSHARLIGEGLNSYFHRQILYRYLDGSTDRFFTETLSQTFSRQRQRPRKDPLLDLFLFDTHLRENNSSLLALFSAMLQQKQQTHSPYESAAWIFDVLHSQFGITVTDTYRNLLLNDDIPDYSILLPPALSQFGYQLTKRDDLIEITPHGIATFRFDPT